MPERNRGDSHTKTCTEPDCDRPLRARGLCSTHYNQRHQPNRHAKVMVACDWCGLMCEKEPSNRYVARVCSLNCRDLLRKEETRKRHALPVLRVRRKPKIRQPRIEQSTIKAWTAGNCRVCDTSYISRWWMDATCSDECAEVRWRADKLEHRWARKAREHGAAGLFTWAEVIHLFLLFDQCCAYCGQPAKLQPDHVVPMKRWGGNSIANILPACRFCNGDKRDLLLSEWNADRAGRGLSPVTTSWPAADPRLAHLADISRHA